MLLKKIYDADGKRVTAVHVVHTGFQSTQKFARRMVRDAVAEGWMALDENAKTLTLKTDGEPLVYRIAKAPGYYCKSTGEAIPINREDLIEFWARGSSTATAAQAQAWLVARGKDARDYEANTNYECELSPAQHEKFRAVRNRAGNAVAAHTVKGA